MMQRDNMGVQLLTMPHVSQTLKKFLVKNFLDVKCLGWDHTVQCLIQLNKYRL